MNAGALYQLFKDTGSQWLEDKAPRMGAALAYYSIFAITPIVILAVVVAGWIFGAQAAQGAIVGEIRDTVGEPVARAIETLLRSASQPDAMTVAAVAGLGVLLFGAAAVFVELQDALNTIWKVEPRPGRGWRAIVKERFFSFTMVLGTGFLLLVSLILSAALAALSHFVLSVPLPGSIWLWQGVTWLVSFAFFSLLFILIFKMLPDVQLCWRDVWVGGLLTAFLFTVGKYLLGLYLGQSSVSSPYGAAGSLVVILVWVYYSAQILLFGAEFTRVYALHHGCQGTPTPNAVRVQTTVAGPGKPHRQEWEPAARAEGH